MLCFFGRPWSFPCLLSHILVKLNCKSCNFLEKAFWKIDTIFYFVSVCCSLDRIFFFSQWKWHWWTLHKIGNDIHAYWHLFGIEWHCSLCKLLPPCAKRAFLALITWRKVVSFNVLTELLCVNWPQCTTQFSTISDLKFIRNSVFERPKQDKHNIDSLCCLALTVPHFTGRAGSPLAVATVR